MSEWYSDRQAIHQALEEIVSWVEQETQLRSRWNGSSQFTDEVDSFGKPPFYAKKDWVCSITIHEYMIGRPALAGVLLHEALHSVSKAATRTSFAGAQGFEEGVVEALTRGMLPQLPQLPTGHTIIRDAFEIELVNLEELRRESGMDYTVFYIGLLQTDLADRERTVIQWISGTQSVGVDSQAPCTACSQIESAQMTRQETINKILAARTEEELYAARKLRSEYLDEHPDDDTILETGTYLSRREDALEYLKTAQPVAGKQ